MWFKHLLTGPRRILARGLSLGLSALLLAGGPSVPAHAADWSSTDVQFLYGNNYQLDEKKHSILTLEHASG